MTIEDQKTPNNDDQGKTTADDQETEKTDLDPGDGKEKDNSKDAPLLDEEKAPSDKEDEGSKDQEDKKEDEETGDQEFPTDAASYDLTIPEELGLKDEKGDPLQFDKNDPLVEEFRNLAFDNKLSQDAASKMMGMYARAIKESIETSSKDQTAAIEQNKTDQLEKLKMKDANGKNIAPEERVQSALNSLNATLGDGASKKYIEAITDARHVMLIEELVAKSHEKAGKSDGSTDDENLRGAAALKRLRTKN